MGKGTGRPKADIDWALVDNYLRAHCDGMGIAGLLGIHHETLYKRCEADNNLAFSEYAAKRRAEGKELLRAKMYEKALKEGDKAMLIWLSKQYLGMSEKTEAYQTVENKTPQIIYLPADNSVPPVTDESQVIEPEVIQ